MRSFPRSAAFLRGLLVAILATACVGCASPAEFADQFCADHGYMPGTADFRACSVQADLAYRRNLATVAAGWPAAQQPIAPMTGFIATPAR